jgi:hypothetical protein
MYCKAHNIDYESSDLYNDNKRYEIHETFRKRQKKISVVTNKLLKDFLLKNFAYGISLLNIKFDEPYSKISILNDAYQKLYLLNITKIKYNYDLD